MNRLRRLVSDARIELGAKRAKRRLHSESIIALTAEVDRMHERLERLEHELTELQADSRRIAELRVLVEDAVVLSASDDR